MAHGNAAFLFQDILEVVNGFPTRHVAVQVDAMEIRPPVFHFLHHIVDVR